MLLTVLVALATLLPRVNEAAATLRPPAIPSMSSAAQTPKNPAYDPALRAVSNWHAEAREHLLPRALALTASLSDDPPYVGRCVRLNNGWCIKSARWPGEIGADGEGHTAFATLADGADAAAGLLRRYFLTYGRRSALAIVRRWAPAECRVAAAPAAAVGSRAVAAPAVTAALAPRGLGRTLRARYLARHRPGGAVRTRAVQGRAVALRVQPWSPLARMAGRPGARRVPRVADLSPVADIASGIGSGTAPAKPARRGADDPAALLDGPHKKIPSVDRLVAESALLPAVAAGLPLLDLTLPAPLCSGDEGRILAYAGRIAGSVGLKAGDDLDLFGPDGAPRPNLGPVMQAMSAVELGTLRAGPDLVAAAIARLGPMRESAR